MRKQDCRSVVQNDFAELLEFGDRCVHHIFQGPYRRQCEKYGFLVAVTPGVHEMIHRNTNTGLSLWLKQECQRYYEHHVGSRDAWIREFGRNYL